MIAAWNTFTLGSVSAHFQNGKWATKSLPVHSGRALRALLRLLSCYYSVKSCCVFQRKGSYFISSFCLRVNASAALAAIFACFNCPLHPKENIQPFFARQLSLAPQEREFPQLVWFHSPDFCFFLPFNFTVLENDCLYGCFQKLSLWLWKYYFFFYIEHEQATQPGWRFKIWTHVPPLPTYLDSNHFCFH